MLRNRAGSGNEKGKQNSKSGSEYQPHFSLESFKLKTFFQAISGNKTLQNLNDPANIIAVLTQ